MRERSNTCCFTGHRDISAVTYGELAAKLEPIVLRLYEKGYRYFVCGGALGFDTFAETCLCSLKARGYDLRLVLMLPCRDQCAKWSAFDKQVYARLSSLADEVVVLSEKYYNGCMQARNRAMVDAASVCICYLNSVEHSGTRATVEYARKTGVSVINIAPEQGL